MFRRNGDSDMAADFFKFWIGAETKSQAAEKIRSVREPQDLVIIDREGKLVRQRKLEWVVRRELSEIIGIYFRIPKSKLHVLKALSYSLFIGRKKFFRWDVEKQIHEA